MIGGYARERLLLGLAAVQADYGLAGVFSAKTAPILLDEEKRAELEAEYNRELKRVGLNSESQTPPAVSTPADLAQICTEDSRLLRQVAAWHQTLYSDPLAWGWQCYKERMLPPCSKPKKRRKPIPIEMREATAAILGWFDYDATGLAHEIWALMRAFEGNNQPDLPSGRLGAAEALAALDLVIGWCKREESRQSPEGGFCFFQDGTTFFVRGFGEEGHLQNSNGLAYLNKLITNQGKPVHAIELIGGGSPIDSASEGRRSYQPAMDETAKREVRERIAELIDDVECAKIEQRPSDQEKAQEKLDAYKEQLQQALGLGGKARDLNSEAAKLQSRVLTALNRTYAKMESAVPSLKSLADHFRASISGPKAVFTYAPRQPVSWQTRK